MRITEHLYYYPWESITENNCNSYVVGGKRKVLIDPGHLHLIDHLVKAMAADGISPGDIDLIIITHPHPDHFEAIAKWAGTSTMVAMHRDGKVFLEEFARLWEETTGKSLPHFPVDFFLKAGTLQVGEHSFRIIETPGHAPGSICVYLENEKVLFSGDVIFARSFGRFDLPGGDPLQLIRSIERLIELDVEILAPGHGPVIKGRGAVKENFYLVLALFQQMFAQEDAGT
ncbi:MAG: MBL fold metallo-hydrolase [Thermodesulforhabdaceae bacterium]